MDMLKRVQPVGLKIKSLITTQVLMALCASAIWGGSAQAAETLTYLDLVKRMTDMEHLAVLPPAGEKGAMASSYDRASTYDAAADKYIQWDANGDGKGFVRKEGDKIVLAEIEGPGVIWRMWSAAPSDLPNGHVRMFFDGSSTPSVDMPFRFYFGGRKDSWIDLTYGHAGEPRKSIPLMEYNPGGNAYIPIPFQKSCKIVADKEWGQYFHFNYTQYPAGTVLPAFTMNFSPAERAALDAVNTLFGQLGKNPMSGRKGEKTDRQELTVKSGQKTTVLELSGPQAITALKVKLALPEDAEARRVLLRQLTVSMVWDDDKDAAVWSPLGDFFGYIGGGSAFQTLPVGLLEDGTFYAYWYMPFAKKARLEVGNDSGQPVTMSWETTYAPLTKPIKELGRFHAKWHRDAFLPKREDRKIDWTIITTQGRGRYLGAMLHVWNPLGGWWGEGDEKFFVDGEKFPSTFGTGSEDYFGYAWGSAARFFRAFHAQPFNEGNEGHVNNSRWQIPDNVPFQTSFDGYIEKYFPNEGSVKPFNRYALYAATAFWYLEPGGVDPYKERPVTDRVGYWVAPPIEYSEAGAIEGESLKVPAGYGFRSKPWAQKMWFAGAGIWSGDKQLVWGWDREPEQTFLELNVPAEKAGKYRVVVRLSKGPEYGIYQLSLGGKKLGGPVDLYAEKLAAVDPVEIGVVELGAGAQTLRVDVVGLNPSAKGKGLFALDYIKLIPAP